MSLAEETEYARVCLYGRFGTGKTTSLATGARLGRVMHIDAEKRLKAGPLRRLGIPVENIEPHREITIDALNKLVWLAKERLHEGTDLAVFGIDAFDETIKILLQQVLEENNKTILERAKKRGEVAKIDPYNVDIDFWGIVTQQVREFLRHSRDLQCHLMFTSHERKDTDDDGTVRIGPAASPAIQADLMAYVDIVGHTEMQEDWRVARFKPGTKYEAKDTFGVLPGVMAEPTLDRIVAYVREELTAENDPVQQAYEAWVEDRLEERNKVIAANDGETRRKRRA